MALPELQQQESPIDQAIVKELISLTPDWWRSAVLEVTFVSEGGVEKFSHVISSPEGHRDFVDVSDELFATTYRLALLFREHGSQWKKATYQTAIENDNSWKYTVDFEY